jgi:predicted ATPase/DNA-binding XRE family transcriptional regulator
MKNAAPGAFGAQLKALREAAGYTQEELATIAGLSVHAVSALERGERRRPHVDTVRALSAALDLTAAVRDALLGCARASRGETHTQRAMSLPVPLTVLLGREADLQTLRLWLDDSGIRLMTLVGPGGVGKTRLAVQLAHTVAEEGSTAVVFVSLAAIRDSAFVAQAIGEALGLADVTALDLPARARQACENTTLLVIDNFEHMLDAAPLVAQLLITVTPLRVLATSRAPLRIRGEHEFAVGPLALDAAAENTSAAALARSPAVCLFVERVRDVRPDFRLTSANGPTVMKICQRLDSLPLALELAARWMKVLTAEDLLRRLDTDVLLPVVGSRDLPERQQTMNATVAWSYQLLETDERRAFRRFGALPGLFPIEAAVRVLGDRNGDSAGTADALTAAAGLIDKSLLVRADASIVSARPLYYMLETVRAYAILELEASGERDDAMEGLVCHCTSEASLAAEGLVGRTQVEWLNRTRDDLENYRGALRWLIDRGRSEEAAHIAWRLLWFWIIRGHSAEGLRWYEEILRLPSLSPAAESTSLVGAASMWYTQASLEEARTAIERAIAIAAVAGDDDVIMHAEFVLGHVEHTLGNLGSARDHFARSLEGLKTARRAWGAGHVLTAMAWVALASGDTSEAERLLGEADLVLRDAGPWFLSLGLYVRGILAVRRGAADEAIMLARANLEHIREIQDKFAFVYAVIPLATAATLKGDDAWAARILGARDAVTDRTGARFADESVRDLREATERGARARLGPERWARAYAAGREASIDSLLNDIDRHAV